MHRIMITFGTVVDRGVWMKSIAALLRENPENATDSNDKMST